MTRRGMPKKAPFEDDAPLVEQIARWQAQSSPDPRMHKAKHRARLQLYDDSLEPTRSESGTWQARFIEPEGK